MGIIYFKKLVQPLKLKVNHNQQLDAKVLQLNLKLMQQVKVDQLNINGNFIIQQLSCGMI